MNISLFRKPGRYINSEINSIYKEAPLNVALCFPDVYEIGMSHLGLKILYHIINSLSYASAERVFAPWSDLYEYQNKYGVSLTSLESGRPLSDFDLVGFTLQYELSYTTVLDMIHSGGISVKAKEREDHEPIVIAGGPCAVNPNAVLPFFDALLIGDGEEAITEILSVIHGHKLEGDGSRQSILKDLSRIEGLLVPGYNDNQSIKRVVVGDLNLCPYPTSPVVPYTEPVHNRVNIEVSRGCTCGCRFCQAGVIYRPTRERSPHKALELAVETLANTGYDEVSFTSLSAGDYTELLYLTRLFNKTFYGKNINLSLPSLRVSSLNDDIVREIKEVRKSGFTIAPEAATDRLREIINKDFTEEDFLRTLHVIFKAGWQGLKLYFMIGLPGETDEDVHAISDMVKNALKIAKKYVKKHVSINVGVSTFVPKPHTPFQWCPQISMTEMAEKIGFLRSQFRNKRGITVKSHDFEASMLESALGRANEKVSEFVLAAWQEGARLDAWNDIFDYNKWLRAMDKTGFDALEFAQKRYALDDSLSWDNINTGVSKEFLQAEYNKALVDERQKTSDCKNGCHGCGLSCTDKEPPVIKYTSTSIPVRKTNRPFSSIRVRMVFTKDGKLRYLSHLELIAAVLKGLRRANVPLVYSKGYNPNAKVAFGPALGVGIGGKKEYLDMEVLPPFNTSAFKVEIQSRMPDGIEIKKLFFIPKNLQSLNSFVNGYRYRFERSEGFLLSQIEDNLNHPDNKWVKQNLLEYDIIPSGLLLFLKDTKEQTIKISSIFKALTGADVYSVEAMRVALYGFLVDRWVEPDDIDTLKSSINSHDK